MSPLPAMVQVNPTMLLLDLTKHTKKRDAKLCAKYTAPKLSGNLRSMKSEKHYSNIVIAFQNN